MLLTVKEPSSLSQTIYTARCRFYFKNKLSITWALRRRSYDFGYNFSVSREAVRTLKKVIVEPPDNVPYLMTFCLARSSADSIGDRIRSTVRNAARFAVYEAMRMSVKNHHMPLTSRVDTARGATSDPAQHRHHIIFAMKIMWKQYCTHKMTGYQRSQMAHRAGHPL